MGMFARGLGQCVVARLLSTMLSTRHLDNLWILSMSQHLNPPSALSNHHESRVARPA